MRTERQNWKVIYAEMARTRESMAVEKARQESLQMAETGKGSPRPSTPSLPTERPRERPIAFSDDLSLRWEYRNNPYTRDRE